MPAFADGDGYAVAFNQPAAFVGQRVRGGSWLETAVCQASELFELGPDGLAVGVQTQLASFQKIFRQVAHLHDESQIAALYGRPAAATLEDFHQATSFLVAFQNTQDQKRIGGVGRVVFGVDIARLNDGALSAGENFSEQLTVGAVDLPGFRAK